MGRISKARHSHNTHLSYSETRNLRVHFGHLECEFRQKYSVHLSNDTYNPHLSLEHILGSARKKLKLIKNKNLRKKYFILFLFNLQKIEYSSTIEFYINSKRKLHTFVIIFELLLWQKKLNV